MPDRTILIDAMDRLGNAVTDDARWQVAANLFLDVGSDWVTAGTATRAGQAGVAIRSSTPDSLMRDYIAARIHLEDPWMEHCATSTAIESCNLSGILAATKLRSQQARLFMDHGVFCVVLVPCYGGPRPGGLVFYARAKDAAAAMTRPERQADLQLLAALVSAYYRPDDDDSISSERYRLHPLLSPREREVLKWLAQGLQSAAIADRMGIEAVTVAKHMHNARLKLGARTREQALAFAVRDRLIVI